MKLLAAVALLLTTCASAFADTYLYVSVAGEKKIALYRMDPAEGKLTHMADVVTDGEPGALAIDPRRHFLFAAIRSAGNLASFRIDRETGKLTPLSTVPAGADPAYVATDRGGRFLLTAYYQAGKVTVHAIGKDGTLTDSPLQTVATADKAHAIVPDPSNRFLFVPHTGPNSIFQFTFDENNGKLAANDPARIETPKDTGPRHLVFHPSQALTYVDNEQGSSVTVYALDTKAGTLKPLQTLSTLPKDFGGANACAEIKVHPSGKFLYASNRGHDSIGCFALDDDGRLRTIGQAATEKTPRSFDLDRSGTFLFAAGEGSGKVASYRIDPKTGELNRLETYEVGKAPWWVMAVDLTAR
jgi:6-phosphogluconolactonase